MNSVPFYRDFVAAGADLFVIECFAYSGELPGHITWDVLKPRLPDLRARRIMLTHTDTVAGRPSRTAARAPSAFDLRCRRIGTRGPCRRRNCHRARDTEPP